MPIERPAGSTLGLARQDLWGLIYLEQNDPPKEKSFKQK